jgi:hypothetical protein
MRTLSLFLIMVAATASAAVTYRWVDAEGVHYSDQPHVGADKIYLGQTQNASASARFDAPSNRAAPGGQGSRSSVQRDGEAPVQYTSCAVVRPADDQVLQDTESVTISVEPHPAKRPNDHVVVNFDGAPIEAATADQLDIPISPIERGTHTVAAELRDSNNKVVCRSAAVSFHVRQPSVLSPANPLRRKR